MLEFDIKSTSKEWDILQNKLNYLSKHPTFANDDVPAVSMMKSQDFVQQRIDIAAKEQWKELDLTGMNLTELPPEIGKLTQLETLRLGLDDDYENPIGNNLTDLPAELAQLTNLTTLSLDNNQFTKIPAVIAKLTNLTRLDLNNNQIAIIPEAIGNLTNLTDLYLMV
jgi:hypothetical protein